MNETLSDFSMIEGNSIELASIDCQKELYFCNFMLVIQGFPTLMLVENGLFYRMQGLQSLDVLKEMLLNGGYKDIQSEIIPPYQSMFEI
mmetsp:Transcript_43512/g.31765  ORF Transcript_43512/g.31765 Transcript_43512/m.31765 type:complete len:89 (+) Transcript_43512:197-463(+)